MELNMQVAAKAHYSKLLNEFATTRNGHLRDDIAFTGYQAGYSARDVYEDLRLTGANEADAKGAVKFMPNFKTDSYFNEVR